MVIPRAFLPEYYQFYQMYTRALPPYFTKMVLIIEIKVALSWSMWPIVLILTCSFLRLIFLDTT